VYLTCSKKLSPPHGTNKKLKCEKLKIKKLKETKNKMMSMIGPVQSHYLTQISKATIFNVE